MIKRSAMPFDCYLGYMEFTQARATVFFLLFFFFLFLTLIAIAFGKALQILG